MTISLRATRAFTTNDVSLNGPTLITQGTTNTYTITDYNAFSIYTVASTVGTPTLTGDSISLVVPTTSATQITLTVTKDGKPSPFVIAVGGTAIITPVITSPLEDAVSVNVSPTLSATAFATAPAGATTHQTSQWQVSTDSSFTTIVFDSGVTTVNKTSIIVPALALSTLHYARVRYTGVTLGTSNWSTTRTFTTTNQYIATPVVSVVGSSTAVGGTPTFTGSAFSPVNGIDTHSASDWVIIKVSDGSVVYQSVGNTTDKTSITIPSGLLQVSTDYQIKLRYAGALFGYSGYGTVNFTTAATFSYEKYLAVALGSSVKVFGQVADTLIALPDLPPLTVGGDSNLFLSDGTVTFSPNGQHLVASYANRGVLTIYKRQGDSFTILTGVPISNPTGVIAKVSYSVDGNYMIVAAGTSPVVFQVSGDVYTRMGDLPDNAPISTYSVAASPDGTYFAVGKAYQKLATSNTVYYPNLLIYKRVGSTFTTIFSSVLISCPVESVRFSPSGGLLAVSGTNSTGAYIMKRTGDSFSIETHLEPTVGFYADFSWSPDSTKLLISGTIGKLYRRNIDATWTNLPYPSSSNNSIRGEPGAAWSADNYVASVINNDSSSPSVVQSILFGKTSGDSFTEIPFSGSIGLGKVGGIRLWPGYQG